MARIPLRAISNNLAIRLIWVASIVLASAPVSAQTLNLDRQRFEQIVTTVSKDIEKNYYDPALRGVDWTALTKQALARVRVAKNVGEMITAVYWLVEQLHDSHTFFIPPDRPYQVQFGFRAKAMGDVIRVDYLREKGSADAAGLQLGDRILKVNGLPADRESFPFMMLFFGVLRPVAVLNLEISRGSNAPVQIKIEARTRKVPTDFTKAYSIWDAIRQAESDASENKITAANLAGDITYGYLPSFMASEGDLDWLVGKLKKGRAIILDLRNNAGGSVDRLSQLLGYFEPVSSVIAQHVGRNKTEPLKSKPQKPQLDVPVFVLIDSGSGSAAEIVARHLQRTGRAKLIGDRSAGKVTVAKIIVEKMGVESIVLYGVEISVARVVFPDGEELEKRGVTPEVSCIPSEADLREKRDTCLQLALQLAKQPPQLPSRPGTTNQN